MRGDARRLRDECGSRVCVCVCVCTRTRARDVCGEVEEREETDEEGERDTHAFETGRGSETACGGGVMGGVCVVVWSVESSPPPPPPSSRHFSSTQFPTNVFFVGCAPLRRGGDGESASKTSTVCVICLIHMCDVTHSYG